MARLQGTREIAWSPGADDYWLEHAKRVIYSTYGHNVSVYEKAKDLLKFGRSEQVHTTNPTTLMTLPTGVYSETYISTNGITTISSSSGSDTSAVTIEGHTIDGDGDLTFVVQSATLTGQTQATLATPLARCTRIYNNSSTDLVGTIYVYENDTDTAGVPDTNAGVHCMIRAGQNSSDKASTTISSTDYWIVTGLYADVLEKTSSNAEVSLEIRLKDKTFRRVVELSCSNTSGTFRTGVPYLIVPPNSDVRLTSLASANTTTVSGGIVGVLASVQ